MVLVTELKRREVGVFELIFMGFNVYLNNWKPILLTFITIYVPFLIFFEALSISSINKPSVLSSVVSLISVLILLLFHMLYFISIAVITDNYVQGKNTNYQNIVKKVFSSFIPLVSLGLRFSIIYILRCLLLLIPGIIYAINHQFYGLAFLLRDKKGKAAFTYSRSIVQRNWSRVFFLGILFILIVLGLQAILRIFLNNLPFINNFWASLLSQVLPEFVGIGISLSSILLFINLEFQANLET